MHRESLCDWGDPSYLVCPLMIDISLFRMLPPLIPSHFVQKQEFHCLWRLKKMVELCRRFTLHASYLALFPFNAGLFKTGSGLQANQLSGTCQVQVCIQLLHCSLLRMPLSETIMVVSTLAVCEVFQMHVFKAGHVYCL